MCVRVCVRTRARVFACACVCVCVGAGGRGGNVCVCMCVYVWVSGCALVCECLLAYHTFGAGRSGNHGEQTGAGASI